MDCVTIQELNAQATPFNVLTQDLLPAVQDNVTNEEGLGSVKPMFEGDAAAMLSNLYM
jgi:hypothetical protein